MSGHLPRDEIWRQRVERSFARQAFMDHIGVRIARLAPGEVDLEVDARAALTQQHGFFHAGVTTTIADSAAGYAALSLFKPGYGVLTTEFKMNLLNPGQGRKMLARGRVIKPGRTLTVAKADVYGLTEEEELHVATGLFTMIALEGMDD
ncbi:hotdog fold thioesterase [Stappia sp. GBMRC 2046]|uniref:Medium/long-chain acyl-CoA thioesterase YigI n=1 Tax=Stappia sediminis TaxID=2692190 RepID=A0A7X3LS78_9HYPH|nr:PaaI family thioesterase [Stappia sediminis]MXN64121.1 hotdog fold thioesterase [Stappia sediminis]